jgi:acetyl esterase/lipase
MRLFILLMVVQGISISCSTKVGQEQKMEVGTLKGESDDDQRDYSRFLKKLKDNEAYIGFFTAEKKYISKFSDEYHEARKKCFLGIASSKEEPFDHIETFIEFCEKNELLKGSDRESWENVLTILSFEMYANMPIFDFSTYNVIEHRSLVYAEYPNKKLALDLFLPKKAIKEPVPIVVCIHGGGWVVNRRIWFEPFAKYLAANGLAAVTIDYRKMPAVELMDIVYDAKAAVRWVRANANKYGIDPDRIGAIGASAGAHLVALLGTTGGIPALEGKGGNPNYSSAVQAVFGIATPAFTPEKRKEIAGRFGLTENQAKLISPFENIDGSSAPLFLLHGTVDETVPPNNSQDLHDRYKEVGAHVELEWVPDEDHGFYEGTDFAIKKATKFFLHQLTK